MSSAKPPSGATNPKLDLEQQRKRAKELLRAHRAGDTSASARVVAHFGPTSELKLAGAQHVVAREAGFDSWPKLKLHLTQASQSRAELVTTAIAAALAGRADAVQTALAIAPDLPLRSLHLAAALADEAAITSELDRSAKEALNPAGPLQATPLAYLCHAELGHDLSETREVRARIARRLIAAGADPNECVDAPDTPGGKLSVLSAAARFTRSAELVDELLAAGAVLEPPGSTAGPPAPPLVGAALGGSFPCLQRLLHAGAPAWQAREALEVAIEREDRRMAEALLAYGCLPDQAGRWRGRQGSCLHAALALGRDSTFLELLLDGGASLEKRDRDGRSPLAIAVQLNQAEAVELFRRRGAEEAEISDVDRLIQACFAHDRAYVASALGRDPELRTKYTSSDHQTVCRAVRRGDAVAVAALLEGGFDPNVPDDDGQTALHLAVLRRDTASVRALLAAGASPHTPSYENLTAWDLARSADDQAIWSAFAHAESKRGDLPQVAADHETLEDRDVEAAVDALAARRAAITAAFEEAVELMGAGNLVGLQRLLDREPALTTARSHRFHRATLLHYLGNNGTERRVTPQNLPAIATLLLERGAVVDASCNMYGGGPHKAVLGLAATTDQAQYPDDTLAELIGVLVRGGARVHEADGTSQALKGALMYGATTALRALAQHGARAYDLPTAAALGDLAALESFLPEASENVRIAAFEAAAVFDQVPALQRLLEAGAELDALGDYGGTALHRAAASNSTKASRWLLEQGADPRARDRTHQGTPADWARHFGSSEALELLSAALGESPG